MPGSIFWQYKVVQIFAGFCVEEASGDTVWSKTAILSVLLLSVSSEALDIQPTLLLFSSLIGFPIRPQNR